MPEICAERVLHVGRSRSVDARINKPHISRVHCYFRMRGNRAYVRDEGSFNGCFLNSVRIKRHVWVSIDMFDIIALGQPSQPDFQMSNDEDVEDVKATLNVRKIFNFSIVAEKRLICLSDISL